MTIKRLHGGTRIGSGNRKDDPRHFRLSDVAQGQLQALVLVPRALRDEKVSGRELIKAYISEKWRELDIAYENAATEAADGDS